MDHGTWNRWHDQHQFSSVENSKKHPNPNNNELNSQFYHQEIRKINQEFGNYKNLGKI